MSELDEKMEEYEYRFDDQFPRMCCRGMSDKEVVEEIDRCLKAGKPFDPYAGGVPRDAAF